MPTLDNPDVQFKTKNKKRIKIDLKKNKVKVEAPDPQAFWAEVLAAGGIAVDDGQVLKVDQKPNQDKFDFKFDGDGTLKDAKGPSIQLRCSASDAAGNAASVTVGPGESGASTSAPAARLAEDAIEVAAPVESQQEIPADYALAPNYPNPFNPTTTIEFALPEAVEVSLRVFDVTGREVARLVEAPLAAGTHRVSFDASGLSSGVYLYHLRAGAFTQVRRMVLVK